MSEPRIFRQSQFPIPPGATEIVIVRHGESQPYVEGVPIALCEGQDDPPLDPIGHRQAEWVADRLEHERVDAIYATSLCRTVQTATPLSVRSGIPITIERDLREVNLGEWEGGTFRQRLVDHDPLVQQMRAEETWDMVPGAESKLEFRARIISAIERIVDRHPGDRVVAFTHAGTISTLVSIATGSRPFAFLATNNGAFTKLVVSSEGWQIRSFNETGHLRSPQ